ncbi:hypothetical protein [Azospirillum isscasi]|uniref:Uncharacterized protein n=1 Tax=Azospirillum isscasi TaxID=3053926 RepID=A0ABU0WMI3_9PROT|nr:hypothetical protein [Azospirillum isscasi]MDQ2105218.1 hypothetical protein [Azospirillum isscasi]
MLYGFGRLALVLWLCAVGGQVFTLFAFHNAVAEAHTAEIAARASALASRVAASAAERAAIGFPLADQNDLQRLIELASTGGGGLRLYVVDPRGTVLFATAQAAGTPVPASWMGVGWMGAGAGLPAEPWTLADRDGVLVGVPVADALGKPAGAVLGLAPQQDARVEILAALRETATVTAVFLAAIGVLAVLGTRLLLSGICRSVLERTAFYAAEARRLQADAPAAADDPALSAVLAGLRKAEAEAARIDGEVPR